MLCLVENVVREFPYKAGSPEEEEGGGAVVSVFLSVRDP